MGKKSKLTDDQRKVDRKVQATVKDLNAALWLASVSGLKVRVTTTVQSSDMAPERTSFDLELIPDGNRGLRLGKAGGQGDGAGA